MTSSKQLVDNHYVYVLTIYGIRVAPHTTEWAAYYRVGDWCKLILVGFTSSVGGEPPAELTIPVRTYDDLCKELPSP